MSSRPPLRTSENTDDARLAQINSSGFPLQIGLAHLIETEARGHWRVRYIEHAYETDRGIKFADLVIQNANDSIVIVIECKRVRDVEWIFLPSEGNVQRRRVSRGRSFYYRDGLPHPIGGWTSIPAEPDSPVVTFCTLRGQTSAGSREMLEGIASEVVAATDAIWAQEAGRRPNGEFFRTYYSAVVTNAPLLVASFDPASIDIATGELGTTREMQIVPWLRFRKALSHREQEFQPSEYRAIQTVGNEDDIVFVINSNSLLDFLTSFEPDTDSIERRLQSRQR